MPSATAPTSRYRSVWRRQPHRLWRSRRMIPASLSRSANLLGGIHLTDDDELDAYDELLKEDSSQSQSEGAGE